MRFSLVLATVGRVKELDRFLQFLARQTFNDFELIVVDQNPDDRLVSVLEPFQVQFLIKHLRSTRGASRARNVGLRAMQGEIVAFPDDDCWYPKMLLEQVNYLFQSNPEFSGFAGIPLDENGEVASGRFDLERGSIHSGNVWTRTIAVTLFFERKVVDRIGGFDESLGVGAGTPWGAGEETDYSLRAIENGFKLLFDPDLIVHHPMITPGYGKSSRQKQLKYSRGIGRVMRKHHYPLLTVAYHWLRPFGGTIVSLLLFRCSKALYHWSILRGRVTGWSARI